MVKPLLFVLTNPTSPKTEAEFNNWYNKIHAAEVCAIDGFGGMMRRHASKTQPMKLVPSHKYLAVYETSNPKRAIKAFEKAVPHVQLSETVDAPNAVQIVFEPIFEYQKPKKAAPKRKAKTKAKRKSK